MREPEPQPEEQEADAEEVARQILLRQLTDRPRSRTELAQALAKRNVPDDVAEPLLERFGDVGLIDDEAFARAWADSRRRTRGLASRALSAELRRKGVDDETVREVLDEIDPEDERAAAHRLVQKKLRSMDRLDDTTKIRRLTGMLARKGYSAQLAFDVVKAELEAESAGVEWISPEHVT